MMQGTMSLKFIDK